jgi:hypothetical protein
MNSTRQKAALFVATLMLLASAGTKAAEAAEEGGSTAPGVVGKVEKAVVRGAKAAAHGIERGAQAAERGIKRGVKAAASGVERGAKATGNAAHTVAEKVGGSSAPTPASGK